MHDGSLRVLVFCTALALCAALGTAALAPPPPLPADAPAEAFSATRAAQLLEWIAPGPHPIGSPANAAVRDRLVVELSALGFAVEVQRGPVANRYGQRPAASYAIVEDIVARKPGREGGPALVLMSHYDARWHAPGAADAGIGVATILEAVRALGRTPLARDLMVVLTDGEEVGLLGAQRWVDALPERADVGLVLNFEARGSSGPAFMFETSPGNGALIAAAGASLSRVTAQSLGYEVYQRMPNDTDFSVVKAAGIQGLNFAPIGTLFDYHSPTDVPANLDRGTLQQMGDYAVALSRRFGAEPLPLAPAEDVVFFDLLGRKLVSFPILVAQALVGACVLLYALLAWRLRRRGELDGGGVARAALWLGVTIALVAIAGTTGAAFLAAADARWWAAVARMGGNATAWGLIGAGIAIAVAGRAARGFDWRGRMQLAPVGWWTLGLLGLLPWLLAAVAASFAASTASTSFSLPLALALLGHHAALSSAPRARVALVALLLGAAWGWCAGAQLVWLFHQALGYASPWITALVAMLLIGLALPALAQGAADESPRAAAQRGAALAAPLAAGLVLLFALAASPPWSARFPRPVDAFAIADHDAGQVLFASGDAVRDAWQLGLVPETASLGSMARIAPGASAPLWTAPARGAALDAPPAYEPQPCAGGCQEHGGRFRPPPGALAGSLWLRSDAAFTRIAIDGRTLALPKPNSAGWTRVRWFALPPEGVMLELDLARAAEVELVSVSLVPGFPKPFAAVPAARLPATMPPHYGYGDTTVVLKRFEL